MNIRFSIILFGFILIGCSEKLSLAKELACSDLPNFEATITKSDFNKKFSIEIPENWKYKGYFDDYQSSIFAADTIKELTETFILEVAYKYTSIEINDAFKSDINQSNSFDVLKFNVEEFKGKPSYWQVVKGVKNGYVLHEFQHFIQDNTSGYLEIKTEFYGEEMVDERLCEALRIINTLEFN